MEYMNKPEHSGAAFGCADAQQESGEPSMPLVHPK
jgi:hypothetical protein